MATSDETAVHAKSAKIPRFSTQDGFRAEFIDVPQNGCRLAVSGYRKNANDTFIDLFTLKPDSESKEESLCRTFQPYFSKEFTRLEGTAWRLRCVCVVDGSMFVTCFGDTIELYNSGNGQLVAKCKFSGEASCMTIRDKRIYLCLYKPTFEEVIVFDLMLTNQTQRIKLAELTGWPCDVAVSNNKLFICTEDGRALMYNSGGDREQEYKKPNQRYSEACSITVSEENELIYILWKKNNRRSLVVVYYLPEVHSSFSHGHILASFDIPDYSSRIRINNIVNRLFVVATKTGELYEYHTENVINLQNLLRLLEVLMSHDGNQKLLKYFKVPTDKAKTIRESKEPSKSLFLHLRETCEISDRDMGPLLKACDQQGIPKVTDAWTNFLQFLAYQRLKRTLKKTQLEKKEQTEKIAAGDEQREQLTDKLREVTSKLEKSDEKLQQCQNSLKEVGDKNQQLVTKLNATEEEPKQFKDSLETTKEEKQQLVRKITDLESEKQQLLNERKSLEGVAEEREQLKRKIKLIEEENSTLRSQFLRQTSMEERRERVTLGIPTTEKRLVSVDFVEEEHTSSNEKRTPEVLAALSDKTSGDLYAKTTSLSPSSHEKLGRESTSKREPYIEHKINHKGGTITVAGVNLSIPDGALSNDRVIAVTVIRDPVISIPGSAPRGRMTPLIKLEPIRLQLNKSATLTIPHSAIIPEPDRHGVTVFTGLSPEEESQKDQITWKEEKSLKGKLKQETISLDISQLAYIVVNLESREKGQKHIFRVVPFIDGILHAKDDVLITVCFCRDNEAAYQLLVKEQKSKLTLGNYTTFQVSRVLNEFKDSIYHLDLVMLSQGGNYNPSEDDAKKIVDIDHLCAASTVTQQFRLKRGQDGDIFDGIVDVKLTVSQGEENRIPLTLKSKVKDILLSPQDQGLPNRDLPKGCQRYENLKRDVARRLNRNHCKTLAFFFHLTRAETDQICDDAQPGMSLIEKLDQQELIMKDKMIDLYEGLRTSKLDKIGRLVLDYIDLSKREGVEKNEAKEKLGDLQESDLKLTRNAKVLVREGFNRLDVQRALELSYGRVDLGRRILLVARHGHERLSFSPGFTLHKEHYMDQYGGELHVAGVILRVPAGALNTGRIISLGVSVDPTINGPVSNQSLRITPFVTFGPKDINFDKTVTMIIPHCALVASWHEGLKVYAGQLLKGILTWSPELKNYSCSMKSHHVEVKLGKPCLIGPHIPYHHKMKKQICVVPILRRCSKLGDESIICLWFYNDFELEYHSLVNEEVYKQNNFELHNPVSFELESMRSTLSIKVNISTPQCSSIPNDGRLEIDMGILWLQNRHKVEFHLQNTGGKDTVNLAIEGEDGTSKNLFCFSIQLKLEDMFQTNQVLSPFQKEISNAIDNSFKRLKEKLADCLNAKQATQLAHIFHLAEDVISCIEKHAKPGFILLRTLDKKSLISPANISNLESALTEQLNEECVKLLRDFRKNNPVVEATLCQEAI